MSRASFSPSPGRMAFPSKTRRTTTCWRSYRWFSRSRSSLRSPGDTIAAMSYAIRHRDNVRGIVVMNSWAWPASVPQRLFSSVMGGWPFGYWLQTQKNFFAKTIVPRGIHHTEKVTKSLRKAYTDPFPTPASRRPTGVFPQQIRKARPWLAEIESKLVVLRDVQVKILWGMKDEPGFRPQELARWQSHLERHETEKLDDSSHFVQEDRPDRVAAAIRALARRER